MDLQLQQFTYESIGLNTDGNTIRYTVSKIERLEQHARQELDNFLAGRPSKSSYGFELFRLALVERNEQAWTAVIRIYGRLVLSWVKQHPSFPMVNEEADYFVNRTFERLIRYVGKKEGKFFDFDSLAALLEYLKMCAYASVLDDAPAPLPRTETPIEDTPIYTEQLYTQTDHSDVYRNQFWQLVDMQLKDEAERIVMYGFFLWGYRDREIRENYPTMFKDNKSVANKRGSVLKRLARLPAFQEILRDFVAEEPTPIMGLL
ncbi:MAG: hypothetical protein AAF639_08885 [Chloroflexota bacterium]